MTTDDDMTLAAVTDRRNRLSAHYYSPLPLHGKIPAPTAWQKIIRASVEMTAMWEKVWPSARDTGILTAWTPALDLDILREDAAEAAEDLVRERIGERGITMIRIGKPPKRLILFQASEPFAKITINFAGAEGEKIEFLGVGQQCVVSGIHVETRRPYRWFGGTPWIIDRYQLAHIRGGEARVLADDVASLLINDFGYVRKSPSLSVAASGPGGVPAIGDRWTSLIGDILAGRSMHDSTVSLAAMLIRAGLDKGAAMHLLGGLMENSSASRDQRWESRYRSLPRAIDTAVAKYR